MYCHEAPRQVLNGHKRPYHWWWFNQPRNLREQMPQQGQMLWSAYTSTTQSLSWNERKAEWILKSTSQFWKLLLISFNFSKLHHHHHHYYHHHKHHSFTRVIFLHGVYDQKPKCWNMLLYLYSDWSSLWTYWHVLYILVYLFSMKFVYLLWSQ